MAEREKKSTGSVISSITASGARGKGPNPDFE